MVGLQVMLLTIIVIVGLGLIIAKLDDVLEELRK